MKKTLLFLLLVCISLFTLTGCGKGVSTKQMATEDEIEEFFKDKLEAMAEMFEEEMTYSFKMSYKRTFAEGADEGTETYKSKGRVSIDVEDLENSSIYVKTTTTIKGVEYGSEGKTKVSGKDVEESTLVQGVLYTSVESSYKEGESESKSSSKTKVEVEGSAAVSSVIAKLVGNVGSVENLINGEQIYIDGDKCLIVSSTTESHTEVTLVFDGDELVSAHVETKSYNYEYELDIEYGKIKSISKPSNASKYESVED